MLRLHNALDETAQGLASLGEQKHVIMEEIQHQTEDSNQLREELSRKEDDMMDMRARSDELTTQLNQAVLREQELVFKHTFFTTYIYK